MIGFHYENIATTTNQIHFNELIFRHFFFFYKKKYWANKQTQSHSEKKSLVVTQISRDVQDNLDNNYNIDNTGYVYNNNSIKFTCMSVCWYKFGRYMYSICKEILYVHLMKIIIYYQPRSERGFRKYKEQIGFKDKQETIYQNIK